MNVKEVVSSLAGKGITIAPNLVYLIKGKMRGETSHRRKVNRNAAKVASTSGNAVATIIKVKALAAEVGGLGTLRALVDALSA